MSIHEELALINLFQAVRLFTLSAGGDGDGWVVSNHYGRLADEFERMEKERIEDDRIFTRRTDGEEVISFSPEQEFSQEAVFFVSSRSQLPNWAGDIVVELP